MTISGEELRCRRLALGFDQSDLAYALDVKQVVVSRWERGDRPVPSGVVSDIEVMEAQLENLVEDYVRDGAPVTYLSDQEFWSARPDLVDVPLSLQQIAAARARRSTGGRIRVASVDRQEDAPGEPARVIVWGPESAEG